MKHLWMVVVFFCIVHKATGDMAVRYEGMDRNTVTQLIKKTYGVRFDFVNEAKYTDFMSSHRPKSLN